MPGPLANITREVLEPVWNRRDIPISRMAERLGVTPQGLSWRALRMGLPSRRGNREMRKKCSDDVFRRMWDFGVKSPDIARYFGYAYASRVRTRRMEMGLAPRPCGFRWKPIEAFWEAELARKMKLEREK